MSFSEIKGKITLEDAEFRDGISEAKEALHELEEAAENANDALENLNGKTISVTVDTEVDDE